MYRCKCKLLKFPVFSIEYFSFFLLWIYEILTEISIDNDLSKA